jgi:hypothetical protein
MQDDTASSNAEFFKQFHGHEPGAWIARERTAIVTVLLDDKVS